MDLCFSRFFFFLQGLARKETLAVCCACCYLLSAKFNEMYKLEEAVLQQIAELDAAGKSDEAVATYQQLVGILQSTFGVDTLHI